MPTNEFVYIPINKAFVHERTGQEGEKFYSVSLPQGAEITLQRGDAYEVVDISGGNLALNSTMCRPSKFNKAEYTLMYPAKNQETGEPWTIDLKVNPNGELQATQDNPYPKETIKITPSVLHKVIADAQHKYFKENTEKIYFPNAWVKTDLRDKNGKYFNVVTVPQNVTVDGQNMALTCFYPKSYQLEKVSGGYNVNIQKNHEIELNIPDRTFDEQGNAKVVLDDNKRANYSTKVKVAPEALKNAVETSRENYKATHTKTDPAKVVDAPSKNVEAPTHQSRFKRELER